MDNIDPAGEMDFFEKLATEAQNSGDSLILKIIENAKDGDTSSLKLVEKAMNESRFAKDTKLKLTDEQYQRIILLAAKRIEAARSTQAA